MKETNPDINGLQIVINEYKHGIKQRDLLINELRSSNKSKSSCYLDELKKASAEISELKAALAKTTDENLELVEKCEKLKKENDLTVKPLQQENEKLKQLNIEIHNKAMDAYLEYLGKYKEFESKLHRQKELIGSLKRQRRYLVNQRSYLSKLRALSHGTIINMFERRLKTHNQTILDLNAQIGEMRVKLANTVTKMKENFSDEFYRDTKDAMVTAILNTLYELGKITWLDALQCGLKANLPERPANENIVSNHKYNITVNCRRT